MNQAQSLSAPSALLAESVARAGLARPRIDGPGAISIAGHRRTIVSRSLPSSPERILEVVSLHALRSQGRDILVIVVPHLPQAWRRIEVDFEVYRKQAKGALDHASWAVCSSQGGAIVRLDGKTWSNADTVAVGGEAPIGAPIPAERDPLMSEVGLCVLKALLYAQVAEKRLLPPHLVKLLAGFSGTAADLARLTNLPVSSVYASLALLREREFITMPRGGGAEVVHVPTAVNCWLAHRKTRLPRRIAVRPIYERIGDSAAAFQRWLGSKLDVPGCWWAVSGWSALHLHYHGVALTHPAQKPHSISLAAPPSSLLQQWGLVPDQGLPTGGPPPGGHRFLVELVQQPRAVFWGSARIKALPVVDPLQAALDVCTDPDGGMHQATSLLDKLWRVA